MKSEYWAIPLSLLFCLLVWVTSALLNHFVFHKGALWGLLTFNMPAHGAFMGSAGVAIVLLFSILSAITLARLKRSNERNEHQNRILRGIRNVNQLIMKENKREKLIRGTCDLLVEDQGFEIAWILLDDPPGGFACSAGPGHDEELSALIQLVRQDEHPLCVRHLIEGSEALSACEDTSEHRDCPLLSNYGVSTGFVSRLEFGDTTYGFMGVSVPKTMAHDSEETDLFLQAAGDIAHALHNLDVDAERTRAAELYRSVVDTPGVWFIRVNREGQRVFVSRHASQILNRTPEDFLNGRFGDTMIPEDREKAWNTLQQVFRSGKPIREYVTRQIWDGETRLISSSWTPLKDADGNVVEVQTASFDITDRVEADRLRGRTEKFQAVASIASGLAHDINNVLAGIILWGGIASQRAKDSESAEATKNILKAAQDGAAMLLRIRRFSQPTETGKTVAVDMPEIVAECLEFTRPMWKDQAQVQDMYIQTKQDLQPVPGVAANAAEIREVIVNLIQNAVEAMPRGGELILSTYQHGEEVCTSISDTGTGVSPEQREKIFNPYFTTKGREGSGLGLSVVNSIVTSHGGHVEVESEEGKGTTFTIFLPVMDENYEEAPTVNP